METNNKTWEIACYENLRDAIILRAINDVLESEDEARRMNILDSKQERFSSVKKKDAIKFLKSEWFNQLNPTGYSGMELLNLARLHRLDRSKGRLE